MRFKEVMHVCIYSVYIVTYIDIVYRPPIQLRWCPIFTVYWKGSKVLKMSNFVAHSRTPERTGKCPRGARLSPVIRETRPVRLRSKPPTSIIEQVAASDFTSTSPHWFPSPLAGAIEPWATKSAITCVAFLFVSFFIWGRVVEFSYWFPVARA